MNTDRPIAPLFRGRFAPLIVPLTGATISEITLYVPDEAAFTSLHKPEHAFVARIFWNTVLQPVLSAYRDVVARERECAEVEATLSEIRKLIENSHFGTNAAIEALLQYGRDHEHWSLFLEKRKTALNSTVNRMNALFPQGNVQYVTENPPVC
jgi:hypothetical protein